MQTIFAKKLYMSGKFTEKGEQVGVTVLEMIPTVVESLRTKEKHGYEAVRLELKNQKAGLRNASKKAKLKEIRTEEKPEVGQEIKLEEILGPGDVVNVQGISKGKGFAGPVKRYHFKGGPRTHGQSDRERAPGSSGSGTTPGRVFKGKRRAGRMGSEKVTIAKLKVLATDPQKRLITIIGSVPGSRSGLVRITKA